jgi:hypothetical protein
VVAAVLVVLSVLRSASAFPQGFGQFVVWGLVLLGASALALVMSRRFGPTSAAGAVLVSILAVLWVQVGQYPANAALSHWNLPMSRSAAKAHFPAYQGVTLQLGTRPPGKSPAVTAATWRSLVFGDYARALGLDYVNGYTIAGQRKFAALLCMGYEGSTCQKSKTYLFAREPTTGRTYADLMGIDRVVLTKRSFPQAPAQGAPIGWHFASRPDQLAWVLERTTARPAVPGRVVASPGVSVTQPAPGTDTEESMTVSSASGGTVVFSRLLWPGYTATLDGRPVPVGSLKGVFVTVRVPVGASGSRLALSFRPPGTTLGLLLAAGGITILAVLLALQLLTWWRRRGRGRAVESATSDDGPQSRAAPEPSPSGDQGKESGGPLGLPHL